MLESRLLRRTSNALANALPRRARLFAVASLSALGWLSSTGAAAAPISVVPRGSFALPTTATDQHGTPFSITGLSGITHRGGNLFTAVMDNSNKLVHLDVQLATDGSIGAVSVIGGLTLSQTGDYEAIAYTNARLGTVWLANEGAARLDEFDTASGQLLRSLATPGVYDHLRGGFGWESLARRVGGTELWTANEQALSVDGGLSSPTSGTTVRLLRYAGSGDTYAAAEQFAYRVDAWHAGDSGSTSAERSGLVELVQLPDGTLLALERSLAFSGVLPSFENRLYQIDFAGATNVAGLAALEAATFTPVTKQLVWSGAAAGPLGMNMEGLTVGPRLANGHLTLLGIVDDGGSSDPLSSNTLVAFEITSDVADPSTAGDANLDGKVDAADVAALAASYGTPSGARWEDADFDGDGRVSIGDLALLARGLPADAHQSDEVDVASRPSADHIATPEPHAAVLAAVCAAALLALYFYRCRQVV
ncbi:MAG: esterase-like activity of phytase family protein [Pirellulales bacterium]